jgi:hypothetical protein
MAPGGDTDAGRGGKARSNPAANNKKRAASEVTGQGDGGDGGDQGQGRVKRRVRTYWHVYRLAYTRT